MSDSPLIKPGFTYVLIPAESHCALRTCVPKVPSDKQLKKDMENHFRSSGITQGQEQAFHQEVIERGKSRHSQHKNEQLSESQNQTEAEGSLLNTYVKERLFSFEIVPVVMPSKNNLYVGKSLYIDEVGRYKELPLNERASKLAQRDIRGDCFLLANKDDPSMEAWERISTTVEEAIALIENPPSFTPDPMSGTGQALALNAQKKHKEESSILSLKILEAVEAEKASVNEQFAAGSYFEASVAYGKLLDMLLGRPESLTMEEKFRWTALKCILFTNRALSFFKMHEYRKAFEDCQLGLQLDATHKLFVIAIKSCLKLKEFSLCETIMSEAYKVFPKDVVVQNLGDALKREGCRERKQEQEFCQNMFHR